jgi:hypothetical protein
MSPLERHLHDVVQRYMHTRNRMPVGLSVGCDVWMEMGVADISLTPCFMTDKDNSGYSWRGLPIKVVRRKGYVEAMPRRRAARKSNLQTLAWQSIALAAPWANYDRHFDKTQ